MFDTIFCKVCNQNVQGKIYNLREMYLGLREEFQYQLCENCGSMQLINIPDDLSKYYPSDKYYSFNSTLHKKIKVDPLRKIKAQYLIFNKQKILGSLFSIGYKVPEYFSWLKNAKVDFDDAILDVGCGDGGFLVSLCKNGFINLTGIDPFNPTDLDYGGVKINKKDIFEIAGQFDFIMLNHVFEHLHNPKEILQKIFQLLKPQRYVLIRTPVICTYAWNKYKENWMSLDAPRHLIIHSIKSMHFLAEEAGFTIKQTVFDSTGYSLIGSEQYKRDIPLIDPRSYVTSSFVANKNSTLFTKEEIENYLAIAEKSNIEEQGDQASFYLYKS